MATNNNINFANQTVKGTPTTADSLWLYDVADANKLKQSLISNYPPINAQQISQYNAGGLGIFTASLPGQFGSTQSDSITTGLGSLLNTRVVLIPFVVPVAWSPTKMYIPVKVGLAASSVTMGMYASSNGLPTGAALTAASVATTAANTLVNVTISASLSANTLYYAAIQLSSSVTLAVQVAQVAIGPAGANSAVSVTINAGYYSYTNSYSAGTLPTISQPSLSNTPQQNAPVIACA